MQTLIPYLPPSISSFILFFIVGLLIGVAIKKAVVSAVLVILAALIASFAGLNALSPYATQFLSHVPSIVSSAYHVVGPLIMTVPIAFLIGLVVGFWKG
jgi:hypothetical protein